MSDDLYPELISRLREMDSLRQQDLLPESQLHSKANDLAIEVWSSSIGTQSTGYTYWKGGWLRADEIRVAPTIRNGEYFQSQEDIQDKRHIGDTWVGDGAEEGRLDLHFHPFRLYPLQCLNEALKLRLIPSNAFFPKGYQSVAAKMVKESSQWLESPESLDYANRANGVADLAILLEPLYWPRITSKLRGDACHPTEDFKAMSKKYREDVLGIIQAIGVEQLTKAHEKLLWDAHEIDGNDSLYLVLRNADWDTRKNLKGALGQSVLFRHMAELIRRATEEVHAVKLLEEDQWNGPSADTIRTYWSGDTRPLDNPRRWRKRILQTMGLDASAQVRWYVEGETELEAFRGFFGDPIASGVEVFNLKGVFKRNGDKQGDTVSLLERYLEADRIAERFTFFSLDSDVKIPVDVVKKLATNDLFTGWVMLSEPDFEFGNFSLDELVEIAIEHAAEQGLNAPEQLREADWSGVDSGDEFERRYELNALTRIRLKANPSWARKLMRYALEKPVKADGAERPLVTAVRMALQSKLVNYKDQREFYRIDPRTLKVVKRDT